MEGILDSLEDALVVLNAKREVVFCNQAAEGLLGQTADSAADALAGPLPAEHPLAPVVTELFDAGIERRNSAVEKCSARTDSPASWRSRATAFPTATGRAAACSRCATSSRSAPCNRS